MLSRQFCMDRLSNETHSSKILGQVNALTLNVVYHTLIPGFPTSSPAIDFCSGHRINRSNPRR